MRLQSFFCCDIFARRGGNAVHLRHDIAQDAAEDFLIGTARILDARQGRIDARARFDATSGILLVDTLFAGRLDLFVDVVRHLILPSIALGSIPLAIITRITRASVIEVANEDYVRTARSKGLKEKTVDNRHVMRNAWLPVTTVVGLQVGGLLGGAVLTETVFVWNGVGRWVVDAIENHDYPIVQSTILVFAVIFLVVNLIVDVGYALLNPKIRYQ